MNFLKHKTQSQNMTSKKFIQTKVWLQFFIPLEYFFTIIIFILAFQFLLIIETKENEEILTKKVQGNFFYRKFIYNDYLISQSAKGHVKRSSEEVYSTIHEVINPDLKKRGKFE